MSFRARASPACHQLGSARQNCTEGAFDHSHAERNEVRSSVRESSCKDTFVRLMRG